MVHFPIFSKPLSSHRHCSPFCSKNFAKKLDFFTIRVYTVKEIEHSDDNRDQDTKQFDGIAPMVQTKKIRMLMVHKGILLVALADGIGVSSSMASKLIHGHRPLYRYRQPLADLLGVDVRSIFPDGTERRARRSRPQMRRAAAG